MIDSIGIILSADDYCKPVEERIELMQTWTCAEVEDFQSVELGYVFSTYIVKSM